MDWVRIEEADGERQKKLHVEVLSNENP